MLRVVDSNGRLGYAKDVANGLPIHNCRVQFRGSEDIYENPEETLKVLPNEIQGKYIKQVWVGDTAMAVETEKFDATDIVLSMPAADIRDLEDHRYSTDHIGNQVVQWGGPHDVEITDSICEFFGVDLLEDIDDQRIEVAIFSLFGNSYSEALEGLQKAIQADLDANQLDPEIWHRLKADSEWLSETLMNFHDEIDDFARQPPMEGTHIPEPMHWVDSRGVEMPLVPSEALQRMIVHVQKWLPQEDKDTFVRMSSIFLERHGQALAQALKCLPLSETALAL